MEHYSEKKKFSLIKRAKSLTHAFRGIRVFFKTQHNAWVHLFVTFVVIVMGIVFSITPAEWALLAFAIGMVLVSEAVNTAIEIDIDLTSPGFHPYARDTKDVAAGAVLLATFSSVVIGVIIFAPYIFAFVNTH